MKLKEEITALVYGPLAKSARCLNSLLETLEGDPCTNKGMEGEAVGFTGLAIMERPELEIINFQLPVSGQ